MKKPVAIYTIKNEVNGKHYVGIAVDLKKRWSTHRRCNGNCVALYSAIKNTALKVLFLRTLLMPLRGTMPARSKSS